ncbi:MAG: carotenoid oxygenase family protein, partial [Gammaproteobacteria bacterium]|nr:carotenoid oxygenase family protein [Gammaproteobacteria bacterium]
HGELLALWEGGSASVIDRETLAWQGFKSWGESVDGLPFTAHPKVEIDGTVWAFGYTFAPVPAIILYHIAPDGTLRRAHRIDVDPMGMVHDFVVTDRHLVIVVPPLVVEPSPDDEVLLDALAWRPALGSRVLVVGKDDFDTRRWYQLPAGFGFHHGNGWEDASGTIRFDHCVASDATLVTATMRDIMRGMLERPPPETYTRFTLHPDGRAEADDTGDEAEFPAVAPAVIGRRNRYVYTVGAPSSESIGWRLRQVVKRDQETGDLETFDYGPGTIAEEHVFVPRRDSRGEDDGWLIGAYLDYMRKSSGIAIFDARGVADGPVARASLDYALPLALHGNFSAA